MTEPAIPPPSKASWLLVIFAVLVLVALGLAYWWVGSATPTEETSSTDDAEQEPKPAPPKHLPQ